MSSAKTFLCLDFGTGSLKAAEFEITESEALCLRQFGAKPLGLAGAQDSARERVILKAIQELLPERGFVSRDINVCAPGVHAFTKFVKLPPVDTSKVTQIIQYEAQQNVPFALDEVVWDYQITGSTPTGELEVLLVAIKSDIVEGVFRTGESGGCRLQLVDVSPAALANAFRYNYSDVEGCTMLLDIGAKTSNVLFFEKDKFFARSINIGANSITQEFAAEARMPFTQAEQFKISEGFVSLGGAYEEPDNPRQAQISKIARQVMTRLHIQVNQTIQFYRGQQGGSAPERLFLAGGASVMPYTSEFFAEKLGLEVEYFNPFRNVQIDPSVDLEELASYAHSFGEVVGLGLRNLAECPIELNLMPKTVLQKQQLNQKKPYFIATVLSLILGIFAFGWFYSAKIVDAKADALSELQGKITPLQTKASRLNSAISERDKIKDRVEGLADLLKSRFTWLELFDEMQTCLMKVEDEVESVLKIQEPDVKAGIWIEEMIPVTPDYYKIKKRESEKPSYDKRYLERYGLSEGELGGGPSRDRAGTNEIDTLDVRFRAVDLSYISDAANSEYAYRVEEIFKADTNYFYPDATTIAQALGNVSAESATFTFNATIVLQEPIKIK
ncbi:MAG: type IV pilus assembly protein PilM [Verrucomicrobia bacterium]|nr:type IV pilus assembly protein PilM [Verrucomicrobiota bacterium]MCF7708710.1 type IV pilus assembly protein PilM [Verrucomicrobiota bacterium]